jgi:hypothetical protein
MSKVKIQGHASGTGVLTVTAPNTSTDRTITLPDATGTLATTADTTDLDGAVVINESGADVDFRVESDTNANALFVQGSDGNVGIGEAAPATAIEVTTATPYITLHNSTNEDSDGGRESKIVFKGHRANATETTLGQIECRHDGTGNDYEAEMLIGVNNHTVDADSLTTMLHLTSDGRGVSSFTVRAQLNYDGNNNTVRASHNVSSVTDNATGIYILNFANDVPSANYTATGSAANYNDTSDGAVALSIVNGTGSCKMMSHKHDGTNRDRGYFQVLVTGG